MTVLLSADGTPVRKVFRLNKDGEVIADSYPDVAMWKPRSVKATDYPTLLASLQKVAAQPRALVISGALRVPVEKDAAVLRRYRGEDAPFEEVARRWVALDVDDMQVPSGTLEEMAERAMDRLPVPFCKSSAVIQWSSQQGLVGREGNLLRFRAWFLLDEAVPTRNWREYSRTLSDIGVDPALYNPVQPHYTATPEFKDGIPDPIPAEKRFMLVERGGRVPVAEFGDALRPPSVDTVAAVSTEVIGFEPQIQQVLARLEAQQTSGARHHHALAVACELVAIGCDEERIIEAVNSAILRQGRDPQTNEAANAYKFAKAKQASGELRSRTKSMDELFTEPSMESFNDESAWEGLEERIDDVVTESVAYSADAAATYNALIYKRRNHHTNPFLHWAGTDFEWTGREWQELESTDTLKHRIVADSHLPAGKCADIAETLRGLSARERLRLGCRLSNPSEENGSLFNLQNGVLHLDDVIFDARAETKPHDPDLFVMHTLPFRHDPNAQCPRWERFLDDCFLDDHESRRELQKLFGYILSGSLNQQKLFVLQGPSRAGKGVVTRMLERLLGKHNVASKPLSDFADGFMWETCWDKSLLLVPEGNPEGLRKGTATHIANELKQVSGLDPRNVRRKGRPDLVNITISSRIVITCNRIPAFIDPADALFNRLHVLRFRQSFAGREDCELEARLAQEVPGIFNWALAGCRMLALEDGRFIVPTYSSTFMASVRESMAPTGSFVDEYLQVAGPDSGVDVDELYPLYLAWAEHDGARPISKKMLVMEVLSKIPTTACRKEVKGGRREVILSGVKFSPLGAAEVSKVREIDS